MLKNQLINYLKKNIKEDLKIEVFVPENEKFGHYSTNAALKLSKLKHKNPLQIAEEIVEKLNLISHFLPRMMLYKKYTWNIQPIGKIVKIVKMVKKVKYRLHFNDIRPKEN